MPRVMPPPKLTPPRVIPTPNQKPVKSMPPLNAKPVRVMAPVGSKPVGVMPPVASRPVRSLPQPTASRVVFSAAPHTADNPASSEQLRARGTTVIANSVFEKIAGQAASEVATSRGRSGGVFGIRSDADAHARPKVDVELSSESVDIDIKAGIAYPGSIRTAAQQIRDHVSTTVRDLTGVAVHRVDLDVTFLTLNSSATHDPSTDGSGERAAARRAKHRKQVLR